MFLLYALGTVLAPCSKENVSSTYCGIVSDVQKIKGYNWAEFTLDFLINHVELFKKKKRTGLVGNLAFLQVADDCFDYGLHEHPLIGNWGGNKVVKRAHLEGVKKTGFAKVVYRLQGDSCKEGTLSENLEEACHEDHSMKGSYNSEKGIPESINDRLSFLERDNHGKFENIVHRIDMIEKETQDQYKSLLRRIEVIEDQTKCLPELLRVMQRVVNFIDRSSGRTSYISEVNIEKEERPKRECVKRKIELVKSPTLVEKVKTRRDRQRSKIYEIREEGDASRYEQAAIANVEKELIA
ncbi:hypothetical protein ABZP36_033695 [Zizania latifolia]